MSPDQRIEQSTPRWLVMMTKYWQPGRVKTRLAASVGHPAAARLHRLFTHEITYRLAGCGDFRVVLASPDHCVPRIANRFAAGWQPLPQGDGDLGQRIWRAISLPPHPAKVVVIGADLPTLSPGEIERAYQALDRDRLVLGPAGDGGYYLIGMNRHSGSSRLATLFSDIAWGTGEVLQATLSRAEKLGLTTRLLDTRDDIDHWDDLVRLVKRLSRSADPVDQDLKSRLEKILMRHSMIRLPGVANGKAD